MLPEGGRRGRAAPSDGNAAGGRGAALCLPALQDARRCATRRGHAAVSRRRAVSRGIRATGEERRGSHRESDRRGQDLRCAPVGEEREAEDKEKWIQYDKGGMRSGGKRTYQ